MGTPPIVGHLASYPPRSVPLKLVLGSIAPQVDHLIVLLNEYDTVFDLPSALKNVELIVPDRDLKDTGKFYPRTTPGALIFTFDDDFVYPPDYVARTIAAWRHLGTPRAALGYHASVYDAQKAKGDPSDIFGVRTILRSIHPLAALTPVDQLGSGTLMMRATDMPPFAYMQTAQRFVDVRLAAWCHERKIPQIALPRDENWLKKIPFPDSIHRSFTRNRPIAVGREILRFAGRQRALGEEFLNGRATSD